MAHIRSFKGYRYASAQTDISTFCAPPYDVQTEAERNVRAEKNPYNVVELELAPGALDLETPNNRYATAAVNWNHWKETGIVNREKQDALYVLEQRFEEEGHQHCRTSFICETKLYSFDEHVVLPHERTLPKALGDRYRLIQATKANFSQVFGLYSDKSPRYDAFLKECKSATPASTAIDDDGVESILWIVTDLNLISEFTACLEDKQVFIADGHHRYTISLANRDAIREETYHCSAADAPDASGFNPEADSEYVMMALVNMDDPQLLVLAYHRAAKAAGGFDKNKFLESLTENFDISLGTPDDLAAAKRPAFLFDIGEGDYLAEIRADVVLDSAITADHSTGWKNLDVSVLQELVLNPIFDISPDKPETLNRMAFDKDIVRLKKRLIDGQSDVVFTMRPTRMEQLREVSLAGETMPQKSTYFYPKLPSGFVFRDITS